MAGTPAENLLSAMADAEKAITALSSADTAQAANEAKFRAALAAKAETDTSDQSAAADHNAAMDRLSASALANKVERQPQTAPPASGPVATMPTAAKAAAKKGRR